MRPRSGLVVAVATVALLGTLFAPTAAALHDDAATEPAIEEGSAFVVDLGPEGDATVALVLTYELADADDERAFERLRENSEPVTARYEERISGIADRTAATTGRDMTVTNATVDVSTTDGIGVVRVSASWTNLAAVEGDRLVVSEPFAGEFRPDRPFVFVAPDGYDIANTTIDPNVTTPAGETDSATAEWTAGTDLSGFSATVAPSDAVSGTTDGSLPTPLAPTLALVAAGLLTYAGWRRT